MTPQRVVFRRLAACLAAIGFTLAGAASAEAQKTFRYQFNEGDVFEQRAVQRMAITMDVGGQTIETRMEVLILQDMTIEKVQDDVADATLVAKRMRFKVTAPGVGPIEFDSAEDKEWEGPAANMAAAAKVVIGSKVNIRMNQRGEVSEVKVPENLVEDLQKLPEAEMIGELFSAEGIEKVTKESFPVFPADAIGPEDEWSSKMEMAMPGATASVTKVYEYLGEQAGDGKTLDKFGLRMQLEFGDWEGLPEGTEVAVKDQTSSGEMLFDSQLGQVTSQRIKHSINLEIRAGDVVIGQTIETDVEGSFTKK